MFGVHIWEICNFISLIWEVWSLELRELILKMKNVDISGTTWNYTGTILIMQFKNVDISGVATLKT